MRYRTKLYIAFVGIALISSMLALIIAHNQAKNELLYELRSKVLSIAATTASLVDGNLLKEIHSSKDQTSADYLEFRSQLNKARYANRRPDTYVRYMYTLKPSKTHPNMLEVVVDASLEGKDISPVGQLHSNEELHDLLGHLYEYYVPETYVKDAYGIWLTGFAPIYDTSNNYVATLGVDIDASVIDKKLNNLFYFEIFSLGASLILALFFALLLSKNASSSLHLLAAFIKKISQGHLDNRVFLTTHDEFQELGQELNKMAQGLQEKELLRINFSHYVSKQVFEKIMQSKTLTKLDGEKKFITVLFSDIRGFTLLTEKLPPEEIVSLLNQYFDKMLQVIIRHEGTLDKFIGDGIMVLFGSPLEDESQADHALAAALEMQEEIKKLCLKWEKEGKPVIQIGIGIHTGDAIVGNIGSATRMQFTAVGDTVNIAARLEQLTKHLNVPILISESTWKMLKNAYLGKNLGPIILPGRESPVTIYSIPAPQKMQQKNKLKH